jgi:putative transcriptional regulator
MNRRLSRKGPTPGEEIAASLREAIRWARGENVHAKVTRVQAPEIDVRLMRRRMRLSQTQFASRFGFAAASIRNWEQGRSRPEGPARVLLAVIAKHPKAVEDALRRAS